MRIIHYSPGMRLNLGGVVRAVLDWCTVLSSRGHEMILVAYDAPDLPADWNGAGGKPKVVNIPAAARPNGFVGAEAVRIWNEVLAGGGVAHLHCPWTASNMQMARAARRRGVPYVVSIHGMLDDWPMRHGALKKRLFLLAGGRSYLNHASRLHFTAQAELEQARKWVRAEPAVLPCLVDLSPYRDLPGPQAARENFALRQDQPVVLFLGRLAEQKGVHILLEAAVIARRCAGDFQLILAGPADDPAYHQRVLKLTADLGLEKTARFVGLVSGELKLSLLQAADLFALPTQHENMGLALIEAMAAGCPVLTTRGTDFWPEIAAAGGEITEGGAKAFGQSLASLLQKRAELPQHGQRGREWVLERFAPNRLAAEYEQLYEKL